MTLRDILQAISSSEDETDFMEKSPEEAMCDVVRSAITQAARDGRLTHGLSDCVTALRSNPSDVVICILPMDTSKCDVTLNIQLLLVESVCTEYGILILKMDFNKLQSGENIAALDGSKATLPPRDVKMLSAQQQCFLIQHGDEGLSSSDKKLVNTFQNIWDDDEVSQKFGVFPI